MNKSLFVAALLVPGMLGGCQAGTPAATAIPVGTSTPISIPGIGAPMMIHDVGVQVISATLLPDMPSGGFSQYKAKPGYVILYIVLDISGGSDSQVLLDKAQLRQLQVVDETGTRTEYEFTYFRVLASKGSSFPISMPFGVRQEARVFSLHFPDGQTIDLASVLKNQ